MTPTFFRSGAAFRRWLGAHHETATEIWLGFHKRHTGPVGLSYREALDEALCHGWIDTQVRRLDDDRYMRRFTPRRARSSWSAVNVARARALVKAGRMTPSGLAAFRARTVAAHDRYSLEGRPETLDAASEARLRADRSAWTFFTSQPPSYRRTLAFWVMSAKKPETRERRLAALIDCSRRGTRPTPFLVAATERA